ncbi:MAG: zinc ribbon domain-containing protein [Candidatus Nanopelagicales bacterium]
MDDAAQICSECSHPLHPEDKFCAECGHPAPERIANQDVEIDVEAPPPKAVVATARRKPRFWVILGGVAAIGIILIGAAWWGLSQNSAAKDEYEASTPVLMGTLDDMSAAQSTTMVRDVAEQAATQVTSIDAVLDSDPAAKGADRLTTLRDALGALAALTEYTQDNTVVWTDNREVLVSNLDTLSSYGDPTVEASAQGDDAVRTLDDLTDRVDKEMARYKRQVKKARLAAQAQRADVRSYHAQMEPLIDRYTALRNDTGTFVGRMDSEQMYMFEVTDYFSQAAEDRREIANSMAALRPPTDLRGVHGRIVTVLGDGADAIDAAVGALDNAECFYGECYFEFNSQWQQFQDESDRITLRYGQAYDAWQAAIRVAQRQAKGAELPPEPQL